MSSRPPNSHDLETWIDVHGGDCLVSRGNLRGSPSLPEKTTGSLLDRRNRHTKLSTAGPKQSKCSRFKAHGFALGFAGHNETKERKLKPAKGKVGEATHVPKSAFYQWRSFITTTWETWAGNGSTNSICILLMIYNNNNHNNHNNHNHNNNNIIYYTVATTQFDQSWMNVFLQWPFSTGLELAPTR